MGVRQGCKLAPGLSLNDSEIKFLLFCRRLGFAVPNFSEKSRGQGKKFTIGTYTNTQLNTLKNIKMEGAESADGLAGVGIIIEGVEVLHDLDNSANVLAICLASCSHWT